jgi:hypothetical protein
MGHPQPVGKEPLRGREDLDILSGDGHPGEGMELHVPQRKGLVKVIGGHFVNLANDVLKTVDISHGVAPFYEWMVVVSGRIGLVSSSSFLLHSQQIEWVAGRVAFSASFTPMTRPHQAQTT